MLLKHAGTFSCKCLPYGGFYVLLQFLWCQPPKVDLQEEAFNLKIEKTISEVKTRPRDILLTMD